MDETCQEKTVWGSIYVTLESRGDKASHKRRCAGTSSSGLCKSCVLASSYGLALLDPHTSVKPKGISDSGPLLNLVSTP